MTPFLSLVFTLAVILLAAKLAGFLAMRLGQPSVLGELLIGILLGPSLIDLLNLPTLSSNLLGETISQLGEMGVLLLMFIAGLELHINELAGHVKISTLASLTGLIFSIGLGGGIGLLFGLDPWAATFLGLALGATSISISARTLMELKMLRSRVGLGLLGAAVIDDVLTVLSFSVVMAIQGGSGNISSYLWVLARMVIFLLIAVAFGLWLLPRMVHITAQLPVSQGALTLSIVILLAYGLTAELVGGMAAIIGAFVAGLMFGRTSEKGQLEQGINALAYGFFVPIFFVNIGLTVNARELHSEALWFVVAIIAIAILGKLIGAALGARLGGSGWQEAISIGAGMIPRGEVTLIIASLGSEVGLVNPRVFSALVAVVLVSTLVTPSLLRLASSLQTNVSQSRERKHHSQIQPADGSLPWQPSQAEYPHSLEDEERKE